MKIQPATVVRILVIHHTYTQDEKIIYAFCLNQARAKLKHMQKVIKAETSFIL